MRSKSTYVFTYYRQSIHFPDFCPENQETVWAVGLCFMLQRSAATELVLNLILMADLDFKRNLYSNCKSKLQRTVREANTFARAKLCSY